MIPLGYMLRPTTPRPHYLTAPNVVDLCSVTKCICEDFADYLTLWRQNGYDLFNSPDEIHEVAAELGVDVTGMTLFYYEAHPDEFHNWSDAWARVAPDSRLRPVAVTAPERARLMGYDVVSFETGRDHSPLSCQHLANEMPVNAHCLTDTLEAALAVATSGRLADCKPGPYRFVAVYVVD